MHVGVSSAFEGYQCIGGIPLVHLWGGVKCIVGIFECIGRYHQCIKGAPQQ